MVRRGHLSWVAGLPWIALWSDFLRSVTVQSIALGIVGVKLLWSVDLASAGWHNGGRGRAVVTASEETRDA